MKSSAATSSARGLKSHPGPWRGKLLLVCGKCQRKLRKSADEAGLSKLKKKLKHSRARVYVINTPCLDVCPRGGVTVCTAAQVARGEFSVVRTIEDVQRLLGSLG